MSSARWLALVANRACAPASKLYCHEQWLREDATRGTQDLKLHQLYRAMTLKRTRIAIEQAIFHRVADLLNLDVEVIFYDTTSLHFEIDEEDEGDKDGKVQGSQTAGKKTYDDMAARAQQERSRRRATDRGRHGCHPGRIPVRHWVFPGNTVDVTTVAKVKDDLRGWQLTRCLFVGDAGMVSQANLQTLSKGGGKYLLAMPMRRGDEITEDVLSRSGRYRTVAENLEVKEVIAVVRESDGDAMRSASIHRKPVARRRIARNCCMN